MVESLRKLREPAAVVLLVVLVLRLLVAVAGLALLDDGGYSDAGAPFGAAATDSPTVVVLVLLVGTCALWSPTPHARTLVDLALVVIGLSTLLTVVAAVLWTVRAGADPGGGSWPVLAQLALSLALPVLALVGLARLRPGLRTSSALTLEPGGSAPVAEHPPAQLEAAPDPRLEPTWQPDQAAGAAWLTAGDAAAGAAASGWGSADAAPGWQPRSGESGVGRPGAVPEPDEPPRS